MGIVNYYGHMPFLLIRGFYPKGRGEVVVMCPRVKSLQAVEMLDPGTLRKITLRAFTAGAVSRKVSGDIPQCQGSGTLPLVPPYGGTSEQRTLWDQP